MEGAPFDLVVSRAAMAVPVLVAGARALLAPGGRIVAMTAAPPEGLDADARIEPVRVPGVDAPRHLVVIGAGPAP